MWPQIEVMPMDEDDLKWKRVNVNITRFCSSERMYEPEIGSPPLFTVLCTKTKVGEIRFWHFIFADFQSTSEVIISNHLKNQTFEINITVWLTWNSDCEQLNIFSKICFTFAVFNFESDHCVSFLELRVWKSRSSDNATLGMQFLTANKAMMTIMIWAGHDR